jgi:hypothetical protein
LHHFLANAKRLIISDWFTPQRGSKSGASNVQYKLPLLPLSDTRIVTTALVLTWQDGLRLLHDLCVALPNLDTACVQFVVD